MNSKTIITDGSDGQGFTGTPRDMDERADIVDTVEEDNPLRTAGGKVIAASDLDDVYFMRVHIDAGDPLLWARLDQIEAKLDSIIARLNLGPNLGPNVLTPRGHVDGTR